MTTTEILSETNIAILYQEKVIAQEQIGQLHIDKTNDNFLFEEVMSKIKNKEIVIELLDKRIEQVEFLDKVNANEQSRIQYNFLHIAREILTRETYLKILDLSNSPLREIKPLFKEFRKDKVSQ